MKKTILAVFATLIVFLILTEIVYASDVKISKSAVSQGGFFEITIAGMHPKDVFTVTFQKRKYLSAPGVSKSSHRVIIPVNVSDVPEEAQIFFDGKHETIMPQKIIIEKADFGEAEKVDVVSPLSKTNLKKYESEQNILREIYRKTTKYPFFVTVDEPFFEYPLAKESKISSPFGFLRKRKVGVKSKKIEHIYHGGIDLVVPKGENVFSVETGIVRLARELINAGNTVIIDHGYNIFSVYMHLSQISISEGDVVWRHDEIGRSGDTGRVTGAHLHFGIKVWDTWVDPKYFVKSLGGEK